METLTAIECKEKLGLTSPLKQQVGGSHYKTMEIQPVEFILANELGFCEGNIIKYTCRYKQKGGVEDLKKVIHYAQLLIDKMENKDVCVDCDNYDSPRPAGADLASYLPLGRELPREPRDEDSGATRYYLCSMF